MCNSDCRAELRRCHLKMEQTADFADIGTEKFCDLRLLSRMLPLQQQAFDYFSSVGVLDGFFRSAAAESGKLLMDPALHLLPHLCPKLIEDLRIDLRLGRFSLSERGKCFGGSFLLSHQLVRRFRFCALVRGQDT